MKIELGISTGSSNYIIQKRINKIEKYLSLNNKVILDLGCGNGNYSNYLASKSKFVIGIDVEKNRLNLAKKSFDKHNLNFYLFDGNKIPFESSFFDLIFMNEVLEHVNDESSILREIWRVLKKDGYLAIYVPNRKFPLEGHGMRIFNKKFNFPIPLLPWLPLYFHKFFFRARTYSKNKLLFLLKSNNLDVEFIDYLYPPLDNINILFKKDLLILFNKLENSPFRSFGMSILMLGRKK